MRHVNAKSKVNSEAVDAATGCVDSTFPSSDSPRVLKEENLTTRTDARYILEDEATMSRVPSLSLLTLTIYSEEAVLSPHLKEHHKVPKWKKQARAVSLAHHPIPIRKSLQKRKQSEPTTFPTPPKTRSAIEHWWTT